MDQGNPRNARDERLAEVIEAPKRRRTVYRRLAEMGVALAAVFGVLQWHGSRESSRTESVETPGRQAPAAAATAMTPTTEVAPAYDELLPPEPSPSERVPSVELPDREATEDEVVDERSSSTSSKAIRPPRREARGKTATEKPKKKERELAPAQLHYNEPMTPERESSRVIEDIPWKPSDISRNIDRVPPSAPSGSATGGNQ